MVPYLQEQIERIFRSYSRQLVRYLQRHLRCTRDVAEDLAQDVFAAALTSRAVVENPAGWLWGTAKNLGARHVRGSMRRRARQREFELWTETAGSHDAVGMERRLDAAICLQRVLHILCRVAPRRRRLVVMVAIEGKSVDQIAKELSLPRSTASAQIRSVRRMLAAYGR